MPWKRAVKFLTIETRILWIKKMLIWLFSTKYPIQFWSSSQFSCYLLHSDQCPMLWKSWSCWKMVLWPSQSTFLTCFTICCRQSSYYWRFTEIIQSRQVCLILNGTKSPFLKWVCGVIGCGANGLDGILGTQKRIPNRFCYDS